MDTSARTRKDERIKVVLKPHLRTVRLKPDTTEIIRPDRVPKP